MSYQKETYGWVAVCDICEEFGPMGDHFLSRVPGGDEDHPLHLCAKCRAQAVWCETHNAYHLDNEQHRQNCASCDGLFSSAAREQTDLCANCRPTKQATWSAQGSHSFIGTVSHWISHTLHI